jgi:uncharacterized protein YecT (DUF1311 family)
MKPLCLAVLLFACSGPALADPQYDRCVNASDGTNMALSACGSDWIARADGELNTVWKQVYAQVAAGSKPAFLTEQRAWNAFKETSCLVYAAGDYGTNGTNVQFPICRAQVIAARTKALRDYGKSFQQQ